jgi:hypothetical protein
MVAPSNQVRKASDKAIIISNPVPPVVYKI